jgi:hypothetical protein
MFSITLETFLLLVSNPAPFNPSQFIMLSAAHHVVQNFWCWLLNGALTSTVNLLSLLPSFLPSNPDPAIVTFVVLVVYTALISLLCYNIPYLLLYACGGLLQYRM